MWVLVGTRNWDYTVQCTEQGTTKPFWKYTKSQKQDNVGVSPLKRDGKLVTSSTDKANILNQQFKSVFTIDSNNELPPLNYNRYPSMPKIRVTTSGISKLLKNLKIQKSSGPDQIPNRLLKELTDEISPFITKLFNKSLRVKSLTNGKVHMLAQSTRKATDICLKIIDLCL